MGLVLHWGLGERADWMLVDTWTRILELTGWILAGGLVYVTLLLVAGLRPRDLRECR
jgi:hypothetical protein